MIRHKRLILAAFILIAGLLLPDLASASQLTQAGVRLGRLGVNAGSGATGSNDNNNLLVVFKLNNVTGVSAITVTFPAGFTINTGTPVVGTTFPNTPAGITVPPGLPATAIATGAGAGAGGTIVVAGLTTASLNTSTLYGFTVSAGSPGGTATIVNPGTAAQYNITVAANGSGGTTFTPVYIYGTVANQDEIQVNASVAPSFSFNLSSNSDTIPTVDPTTVKTSAGVTMTVGTNSPLGYTAYVKSANGALVSATNPGTPITTGTFNGTPDAIVAGTTNYGFVPTTGPTCSSCTGSLVYDGEYSSGSGLPISSGTQAGSFNGTNFASFVSRTGYTNADQISLKERVSVSGTTAYANDYTDTLTIVAAGNF